jgi:hypothetical protein
MRHQQQGKVIEAVVREQKDVDAFRKADYGSVKIFLRDWRAFMKQLAPHRRDIVDVLDK